jgi:hypothetical protein
VPTPTPAEAPSLLSVPLPAAVDPYILFIAAWAALWLMVMLGLRLAAGRVRRRMADFLANVVDGLGPAHRPGRDSERTGDDQTRVMLKAVGDVLADPDPAATADREYLRRRLDIKDSDKLDFRRGRFEWWRHVARAQIEVLPLLGIIGTLGRMYLALGGAGTTTDAATGAVDATGLENLTAQFARSLLSTMAALAGAVLLMWAEAALSPGFDALIEARAEFRRLVDHCRRELARAAVSGPRERERGDRR